jgi:hypothetical protein
MTGEYTSIHRVGEKGPRSVRRRAAWFKRANLDFPEMRCMLSSVGTPAPVSLTAPT